MKIFILIAFIIPIITFSQEEETRYFSTDHEFQKGDTELMYGDNVVLRADENLNSKALDTLRIGDPITIVKMGETMSNVNGIPSYWYKVKTKNKTGYVLGGWISLGHKEMNGKTYLIIFASRDDRLYTRTRVLSEDKSYYGHETPLETYLISTDVMDNQGLKDVEAIFVVSMHAEACGVVGGEAFLFDNGKRLFEAIRTSNMSEAGLFWFSESLEFKGADYWEENIVYYSVENGEYMDDSMDWTQTVTNTVKLTWTGEKFTPDVSKLTFEAKEEE